MSLPSALSVTENQIPSSVFEQFYTRYQMAASCGNSVSYCYSIAGQCVQLSFASPTLVAMLTPALAHLAVPAETEPDLTICLWESESTGILPPPVPWTQTQIDLRGEIPAFSDEHILTAIQTDVNAVSILDYQRCLGVYWIDNVDSLHAYEQAAPLKVLLHWWLRAREMPLIHAAAVGTQDGAVLIVGRTGAGKSTTALACLEAGLAYISDDRCLLALTPVPQVYAIYNSAKLHGAQMARFPTSCKPWRTRISFPEKKHWSM